MNEPYPAGTTHAQARERQEFDGVRAFAPLGLDDPAWEALRMAVEKFHIHTTGENDEQHRRNE